jgi:Zn-dependent M28 family amino/carboxypeptidase
MYPSNRPNRQIFFRTLIALAVLVLPGGRLLYGASLFRGSAAFADTRQAVSFGERPSGSPANQKLRDWIVTELKPTGAQISLDTFSGRTPEGPIAMCNIIAKFPGTSGKAVAVSGHFDTKKIAGVHFVGANDAGSSTGFLTEFARAVSKMNHRDDIYVIFFDGEEALGDWTDTDSTYGSRHLAAKWLADGTVSHLVALINVDMIGDNDLDILNDSNSASGLREAMQKAAAKLGYGKHFHQEPGAIEDDHKPFAEVGVNVLDIIDFTYGPNQSYWHTAKDTMDKLSAQSLQIVGDVVIEMTKELDAK